MRFLRVTSIITLGISGLIIAEGFSPKLMQVIENNYLKEYKKYNSLALDAWEKMPLSIKKVVLVSKKAKGYGMYTKRKSNKYMQGENILIYVEPIGFGHKDLGGFYRIDMESDLIVKNEKGKVVGKLASFGKFKFESNEGNREIYLPLNIKLGRAPVGNYTIVVLIRDKIKKQTSRFSIDVEIIE